MTTLHVFNPEHDLALAFGGKLFTPPHAARELRTNLGFLPALWAHDGDIVLVDDVNFALKAMRRFANQCADVLFLSPSDLKVFLGKQSHSSLFISPWGWDEALRYRLLRAGVAESLLPSAHSLLKIRALSSREQSVHLLSCLRARIKSPSLIGERWCCHDMETLVKRMKETGDCVLKSPWSSSGRGVRYVVGEGARDDMSLCGWVKNVLEQQKIVVVEPLYRKVLDFAMEFDSNGNGVVAYLGLSLFHTQRAAYTGNLLATEEEKRKILREYVSEELLGSVAEYVSTWMGEKTAGVYAGPFGVDMMVVAGRDGYLLHPCVELNLRRTMGHVALTLSPKGTEPQQVMSIIHDVNYRLCITAKENNFVDVV